MTAISYHRTVNDLQGLDWGNAGPFSRASWFALLEQAGHTPLIALARDGEKAVALPLERRGKALAGLTNWYAFTFSPLATAGTDDALFTALARDLAAHTHRIELPKLTEEDLARLRPAFARTGWHTITAPSDTNHILVLNGRNFAAYLAERPGQLRTTLKRKGKKVDVTLSTSFCDQEWSAYEAIYADSWKPEEGNSALLRAFAAGESAAGRYRFAIARHEGEAVAAQFWTVDGNTAFIHKLAHRQCARALSPGTTLSAALFAYVIDVDKVEMVDFGTGDDLYKRDWMEQQRTRWHLTCLRPADPHNWPAIGKAMARGLVSRLQHG